MSRMPRPAVFAIAGALAIALAGCTQVAAIAPVGGDHLAEVRFAAIDVLAAEGVELLAAPDCAEAGDGEITCTGETVDGEVIAVLSSADDPENLTVTVGSDVLYDGSVMDVLEKALRPAS